MRGSLGWAISLALGIAIGYLLQLAGLGAEGWLLGIALSTTALGTLVPILSDSGILPTPLGTAVLGTGVAGEFWPIIVMSVFLTGVYGAAAEIAAARHVRRDHDRHGVPRDAGPAAADRRDPAARRIHSTGQAAVRALDRPDRGARPARASTSGSTSCSARSPPG